MSSIITDAGKTDIIHVVRGMRAVIGGEKCRVAHTTRYGISFIVEGERGAEWIPDFVVKELVARGLLFFSGEAG